MGIRHLGGARLCSTRHERNEREPAFCGTLYTVPKPRQSDYIDWDAGRDGYVNSPAKFVPVVPVAKRPKKAAGHGHFLSIRMEERLASLVAAGGIIWAVYVATTDINNLLRMQIMPPGPVEVCSLGILAWIHAKWRRSMKVD